MKKCEGLYPGLPSSAACPDCGHTVNAHTYRGMCDICSIIETLRENQ